MHPIRDSLGANIDAFPFKIDDSASDIMNDFCSSRLVLVAMHVVGFEFSEHGLLQCLEARISVVACFYMKSRKMETLALCHCPLPLRATSKIILDNCSRLMQVPVPDYYDGAQSYSLLKCLK